MNDETKLILGVAVLGGIGWLIWSNRANAGALPAPQYVDEADYEQAPVAPVVPVVKSPAPSVSVAPVVQQKAKVVPITSASKPIVYPRGANPLRFDPNEKGVTKAYRVNGVNYWLVTLPDGRKDFYSDAEIQRVPAARKVG